MRYEYTETCKPQSPGKYKIYIVELGHDDRVLYEMIDYFDGELFQYECGIGVTEYYIRWWETIQ